MRHHDPLVSIFNLLKIDHSRPARLNAAGRWSFLFAGSPHVRFGAAVKGSCWLVADGELPLWLQEGDGYLLTRGQSYRVCTDPALAPQDGVPLFRRERNGTVNHGKADEVSLVSARFTFGELRSEVMLRMLDPLMHLRARGEAGKALRAAIDLLEYETSRSCAGASVVTHHVAQIMLVQALRNAASSRGDEPFGGLATVTDPRIAVAIDRMNARLDHRWTLLELAREAGMSRSMFALRFKQLTGYAPLTYLMRLRMRAACQALSAGAGNVASVGYRMGYQSESAFSNAFKRVMGASPKAFREPASLAQ